MRPIILLLILVTTSVVEAEQSPPQVTVSYIGGEYRVEVEAILEGEPDAVFDILTDVRSWPQLSDIIVDVEVQSVPEATRQRVRTVSRGCVLAFCKTVKQVQWFETGPDWTIQAEVIADESDLRSGWARTRLESVDGGTLFRYEMALVPDFWVPPLIGPAMIRYKLRREAEETARIVESRATQRR